MAWRPLRDAIEPATLVLRRKRTRILVDESLGIGTAELLRELGYNAKFVGEVGLSGHSDEDILAFAWRDNRMVWTHDADFLDDRRFPEHRNPGVLILPGGSGNQAHMFNGFQTAFGLFTHWAPLWRKAKVRISPTGEVSIRQRTREGRMETTRFRFPSGGDAERWTT